MNPDQQFNYKFLDLIVGETLSGVAFVMDYVEFHFDGAILTALTLPAVHALARGWTAEDLGWRDRLCECIGVAVQSVFVKGGEQLVVNFADGSRVTVSLKPSDYRGPEAINFKSADGLLVVI